MKLKRKVVIALILDETILSQRSGVRIFLANDRFPFQSAKCCWAQSSCCPHNIFRRDFPPVKTLLCWWFAQFTAVHLVSFAQTSVLGRKAIHLMDDWLPSTGFHAAGLQWGASLRESDVQRGYRGQLWYSLIIFVPKVISNTHHAVSRNGMQ